MATRKLAKASSSPNGEEPDKSVQIYKPPNWAWRLLRAFLDPHIKPTITTRCKDANVARATFYEALKQDQFVRWFKQMLTEAVVSDMEEVKLAHLKLCMGGDLDAIRLWYEHYGQYVHTTRVLTDEEHALDALRKDLLGDECPAPKKDPTKTVH